MASIKSISIVPQADSGEFRSEVELFNLHREFSVGDLAVFIYDGRGRIESSGFEGPKNEDFLSAGIDSRSHLHVSLDGSGDILVRGNLDLGKAINLDLEITRGFSVPAGSLKAIRESPECMSIINAIIHLSYENNGDGPIEYIDDGQVFSSPGEDVCKSLFDRASLGQDIESAESYSMILHLPVASKDSVNEKLSQLVDAFVDLEIEYFIAGSTTDGDYEDGSPLIGPEARIDASFDETELYIVDDEICIE